MKQNPGQTLTVIGNCMTGAFPVELLKEDGIDLAVVCQPALPIPIANSANQTALGLPAKVIAATISAMETNPKKQLVSFNYQDDRASKLARTETLATLTADPKLKGDVAKRHLIFIGMGTGSDDDRAVKPLPSRWHALPTATAKGHSTVTGAKGSDLVLFREQLYQVMGLPRTARSKE
jgi:hypothetical protein